MLSQRKTLIYGAIWLCTVLALPVRAADPAEVVAPALDDQTLAVVRVDIQKVDLDALVARIRKTFLDLAGPEVLNQPDGDLENFRTGFSDRLKGFLQAGGKDLYVVVSMMDWPWVAIPIPSEDRAADLVKQVQDTTKDLEAGALEVYRSGDLIFAGRTETIGRLKQRTAAPARSEALAAAFRACSGRTVQAVLVPNADQIRVLAEMLPQVLGQPTAGPQILGLRWAALGLDGPPAIRVDLALETNGPDSAKSLLEVVKACSAWVGKMPDIRSKVPNLDAILSDLTPEVQGTRLVLALDQARCDTLIDRVVGPSIMQARQQPLRTVCASNLRGISQAILIYSNDHDDQFPPDLETLIAAAEMPAKGLVCPVVGTQGSYAYRGAGLSVKLPPQIVVAHDRAGSHDGGRNVLFLDTHVEWVTEQRFAELIRADNEIRREQGLPELPAE